MTTDEQARKIAAGLSAAQRAALAVMMSYDDRDAPCLSAKHLAERSGLAEPIARCAGKSLAASGLAVCETGLTTIDGDFYGSGWRLNADGHAVRKVLQDA